MADGKARPNPQSDDSDTISQSQRVNEEEKAMLLRGQIGSRPPRCERRCSSCGHCEAIQVPTNPQVQNRINKNKNPSKLISDIAYARAEGHESSLTIPR
ncbi:hypothetical protein COLO4_11642 [Corchorus olitorius]|uniref:Epidermal patterning factor-like protein n=1 Tax=Corchorus olitorius TaxID=93759 RepID=A0A1R3K3R3_9ROSI|nr:hypothetical protein COLO4_11642 [Corchorus olitorius]